MPELIPTGYTYDQGRIAINDSFSATGYFNNIEAGANITGATYYSGATPLELIIQNLAVAESVTHVQNGTNTFTGGTPTNPTINITGGTLNNLNITGGTLSSGGTNLYSIFLTSAGANDITRVQPGLNTYTGGTGNNPTVNISAATLTYLSATTISGGTLYSASTNIGGLFVNDISNGTNTTVGGSANHRTVNLNNNIHINNIDFSGTGLGNTFSATTISGGTLYSGSTNLYDIFCTDCGGGSGFSGLTSSTGSNSIIANNGTGNLASGTYGFATGSGTTASGTSSYAGGNTTKSELYAEWAMSSGELGQYGSVSYFGKIPFLAGLTQLFLDGGSLAKEFLIPVNTSYYVKLNIVGVVNSGVTSGDTYVGTAEGVIKNIDGIVSFPGGTPFTQTIIAQEGNFAGGGWGGISISPTTPPGSLAVSIYSLDAEDVNWFIRADYTCVNQKFYL
jgi:hypothetical protein